MDGGDFDLDIIDKENLKNRFRKWGFVAEKLRTNKLPKANADIYIHPSLIVDSVWSSLSGEFRINGCSHLYGIEGSPQIGLSHRRTQLIESESNQLYSPAYSPESNQDINCIDIDLVNDDDRVLDFLKGYRSKTWGESRTPISHIVTPYTSTVKRLNRLRKEFERVNYAFPKIIMVPDDQSPLLLTKSSRKPTIEDLIDF